MGEVSLLPTEPPASCLAAFGGLILYFFRGKKFMHNPFQSQGLSKMCSGKSYFSRSLSNK
jgi:hypothetical protein